MVHAIGGTRGPGSEPGTGAAVVCPPIAGTTAWLPPGMLSKAGHELRGPLTGIAGVAKLLLRHRDDGSTLTAKESRRIQLIADTARQALATVDKLVASAAIEAGHVEATWVDADVYRTVEEAVRTSAAQTAPERISLDPPEQPVTHRTDPEILRPLLAELVGNALAMTNGPVRIRWHIDGERLAIDVADDGPGMSDAELATAFDPFVRGEAAPEGGSGLGLHLARLRAGLLGATLAVRSSAAAGSVFTLTVASAPVSAPKSAA